VDGAGSHDDQETVIALLDNLDCLVTTRANGLGGTGRLFEAIAVSLVFKMRSIAQSGVQKKKKKKKKMTPSLVHLHLFRK
jgi:hypothetical protein